MKLKRFYFDIGLASIFLLLTAVAMQRSPTQALSAIADHVVISEIQIAGEVAGDEFVELYNPTDSSVDLTDWRLTRKTSTGAESNLVASMSGEIPAKGFYLIVSPDSDIVAYDASYSATTNRMANNNSVVLYSDAGNTVIDTVGMGTASDVESSAAAVPAAGESIERKANTSSTAESMTSGADVLQGNGEDTNDNSADFILRSTSDPQNSASATEPVIVATPTPSPEVSPTPTVEPSPSPTPTVEPSPSPSPTVEPSPSPTIIPTPSPTLEPSPTPTATPEVSPTPTVEPSPTPTPTPTVRPWPSRRPFLRIYESCTREWRPFGRRFFTIWIPMWNCS